MSKRIAELMPAHRFYVEPYAGSAAVLLAKKPAEREVLNDIDGRLVNFWRVLRDRPDELAYKLFMTPYAEEEVKLARQVSEDPLEDARRYFVSCTQTYNGGGTKASAWSLSLTEGGWAPSSFNNAVVRLNLVADRLQRVAIAKRDALQLIRQFDKPDAVIYCDPPYVMESRSGGGAYRHEQDDGHHRDLASVLSESKATVLVSGYRSPLYEKLFKRWEAIEFETHKTSAGTKNKKKPEAVEVIWRKHGHHGAVSKQADRVGAQRADG